MVVLAECAFGRFWSKATQRARVAATGLGGGRVGGGGPPWAGSTTIDGDGHGVADLNHSRIAEATDAIRKHTYGNTLDRIEVDRGSATHRIFAWLEHNLAGEVSDGRRARGNQCAAKSRNSSVPRQNDHGSSADFGGLAPPQFASLRERTHVAAAADLNESRSPHSSGSSRG